MKIIGFILSGVSLFLLGFGVAMMIHPSRLSFDPKNINTYDPRLSYRCGILYGMAMANAKSPSQESLREYWIRQGEENSFDGYRVEDGVFKMPGE